MTTRTLTSYGVGAGGDDTAALNAAFADAAATATTLRADGEILTVGPVTIPGAVTVEGTLTLKAATPGQAHVLSITGRQDWTRATVIIDGMGRALDGITSRGTSRSRFGAIDITRCQRWGWAWEPTGNANLTTVDRLRITQCGKAIPATLSGVSATANVNNSTGGYGTYTLDAPLPEWAAAPNTTHWLLIGDEAWQISRLTTTDLDVLNLPPGADPHQGTILVGGGLNIAKSGGSGNYTLNNLDISSCPVGAHLGSTNAGGVVSNAVIQACRIGVGASSYIGQTTFLNLYVEGASIDLLCWFYLRATVISPTWPGRLRALSRRIYGPDEMARISRLTVIRDGVVTANPAT